MPCSACGSSISSSVAPRPSTVAQRAARRPPRRRARPPRRDGRSRARPRSRTPARSSRDGQLRPRPRSRPRSSRGGRGPPSREQQRGVGDVAGQRPALVERGGEGDHPVARDRAVGGLEADDPAERCRLADRAAGVGADRPRRQAGRDRRGRAAGGAAGDAAAVPRVEHRAVGRSSRSRSPSRTRPCWSCRAAGRPPRSAGGRRSRCRAAGSPRGSATRPWSRSPRCRRGP